MMALPSHQVCFCMDTLIRYRWLLVSSLIGYIFWFVDVPKEELFVLLPLHLFVLVLIITINEVMRRRGKQYPVWIGILLVALAMIFVAGL